MYIVALIVGISAGILSGLIGIGGGIIMIPALSILLKFNQHLSQGTTLAAMIPPIGILAAYEYHKHGHVNIPVAIFIAIGFILGGYFGAKFAVHIDDAMLKKIFGIILLILSLRIIIGK